MAARCAALLVCLEECGEVLLSESIKSFTEPAQVTGVFIGDPAVPARNLVLPPLKPGLESATVVKCAGMTRDDVFNALCNAARHAGFTHALVGHTHELLVQHKDSQMVERLPDDWDKTDLYQTVSDVKFRPLVDVFIHLYKFEFIGAVVPAPVPVCPVDSYVMRSWPDVRIAANPYKITQQRAYHILLKAQEKAKDPRHPHAGFLHYQVVLAAFQARLFAETNALLRERISEGIRGWGEEQGLYAAYLLKCKVADELRRPFTDQQSDLFEAAELGLDLGRLEGLIMLNLIAAKSGKHRVFTLALAATCGFYERQASWMGNPGSYNVYLRESIGIGLYMMADKQTRQSAYEQLHAAATRPGARLIKRVQSNYKIIAEDGDSSMARQWFPDMCDTHLPTLEIHARFVTPGNTANAAKQLLLGGGLSWLRTIFQNVVRIPHSMTWGKSVKIAAADGAVTTVPTVAGPWFHPGVLCAQDTKFAACEGFLFVLPLVLNGQNLHLRDLSATDCVLEEGTLYVLRASAEPLWSLDAPAASVPECVMLFAQLQSPVFV
jgi:hypothetical protein